MVTKEYYIKGKIASEIVRLQHVHSLPVNIKVGNMENGLKHVAFEFESGDALLLKWLLAKGEEFYCGLSLDDKWDYDD